MDDCYNGKVFHDELPITFFYFKCFLDMSWFQDKHVEWNYLSD